MLSVPDEVTGQPVRQFHFIRSGDNPTQPLAWGQGQEQVRKALGEATSLPVQFHTSQTEVRVVLPSYINASMGNVAGN